MVPGIIMAFVMGKKPAFANVKTPIYAYILTCLGSIVYHFRNAFRGFDSRFLRIDMIGQHIGFWIGVLLSPLGVMGTLCLLPFSLISLVVANLQDAKEIALSQLCNALCILIACSFKPLLLIYWVVAFMVFATKRYISNPFSHGLFHLICHANMYKYYSALLSTSKN